MLCDIIALALVHRCKHSSAPISLIISSFKGLACFFANTHGFVYQCFETAIFMFLKLEFMSVIVNDRHSCLYSWGGGGGHHNSSSAMSAMPVRPPLCATPTSEKSLSQSVPWHASLHILMYVWLTAGCVVYRWLSTHIVVSFCASVDLKT